MTDVVYNSLREKIQETQSKLIQVGDFLVDFRANTITDAHGHCVTGTEKQLALLALFIVKAPEAVTRDDVFHCVNKGQHVVESSFRHRVKDLRNLFHDATPYQYIENIKGKGYRLISSTHILDESAVAATVQKPLQADRVLVNYQKWIFSLVIVILISVIVFLSWKNETLEEKSFKERAIAAKLSPFTDLRGQEDYAAASPDGRFFLFSHKATDSENWRLILKDNQDNKEYILKEDDYSYTHSRWSMDGQHVMFTRYDDESCQFVKAYFDMELYQLTQIETLLNCNQDVPVGMAQLWKKNRSLLFIEAMDEHQTLKIYNYSLETGKRWLVASPPPEGAGDYFFELSRDEKYLAVLRNRFWQETEVWLFNTETWEAKLIDKQPFPLVSVSWSKDGQFLFYRNQHNQIVKVNKNNLVKSVVAELSLPFSYPIITGDNEERIAVNIGFYSETDILKFNLLDKSVESWVSSSFNDLLPAISSDGKHLAWASDKTGRYQLWIKDGSNGERQLTHFSEYKEFTSLSFSPNSAMLATIADGRVYINVVDDNQFVTLTNMDELNNILSLSWMNNHQLLLVQSVDTTGRIAFTFDIYSGQREKLDLDNPLVVLYEPTQGIFYTKENDASVWLFHNEQHSRLITTQQIINKDFKWQYCYGSLFFIDKVDNKYQLFSTKMESLYTNTSLNIPTYYLACDKMNNTIYHTNAYEGELNYYLLQE